MSNEQASHPEAVACALRALRESAQPLTVAKLAKAIPKSALKSKKDLPELLKQMVRAGQIRSHKARSSVYWLPGLEEQASERILEALSEIPLTQTDLKSKLRSLLIGWPQTRRDEMLARLIKEKRVYKVPPLTGKAALLSVRDEATPQDYVRLALQLAVDRLKTRGLTVEQVLTVAREVLKPAPVSPAISPSSHDAADLERLILERMLRLNPSAVNGAPVQLSQLRQALRSEISDKDVFDRTIMRLAEHGRVVAHRHDYAGGLSQEDLAALVSDGQGNYFIAVTLRD
ncbi:MAG TPA: hypothetical protein VJZ77_02745 [Blastocatellia bacterium]|nr:hypothetical protein [Blastocatellia bacterium]